MESSRLAEVRRCLGLTQKQLAESLKFRTNYIGALECGLRSVSTQFLNRLCLIFPQVNRAYIEHGEGEPLLPERPETPEERRERLTAAITEILDLLDPPARDVIFETIRKYQDSRKTRNED